MKIDSAPTPSIARSIIIIIIIIIIVALCSVIARWPWPWERGGYAAMFLVGCWVAVPRGLHPLRPNNSPGGRDRQPASRLAIW
jgi:flagellar basal body-associated protein FliL